jgi:hypothetical protein
MSMQLTKPKVKRTYVRCTDAETRKTVCLTVYNATPEQIRDRIIKDSKAAERKA